MKNPARTLFLAVLLTTAVSANTDYEKELWTVLTEDTTATVYNAVPSQCNADCTRTASMYWIDPAKAGSYRIIAMERTMMAEYGIAYGDIVMIQGTGTNDGLWQVQDTMNKRFKGQHRIDFLVDRSVSTGKWKDVTISIPANGFTRALAERQLRQIQNNN